MDRYTSLAVILSLSLRRARFPTPPRSRLSFQRPVRLLSTFTRSILSLFIVPFSKGKKKKISYRFARQLFRRSSLEILLRSLPSPPLLDRSDQIFGSPIRLETTRRSTTGTNSYRDPIISTRLITVIREGREVWIETAEAVEGAL